MQSANSCRKNWQGKESRICDDKQYEYTCDRTRKEIANKEQNRIYDRREKRCKDEEKPKFRAGRSTTEGEIFLLKTDIDCHRGFHDAIRSLRPMNRETREICIAFFHGSTTKGLSIESPSRRQSKEPITWR